MYGSGKKTLCSQLQGLVLQGLFLSGQFAFQRRLDHGDLSLQRPNQLPINRPIAAALALAHALQVHRQLEMGQRGGQGVDVAHAHIITSISICQTLVSRHFPLDYHQSHDNQITE